MKVNFITTILFLFVAPILFSQEPNNEGFTYFSKYKKRLISPETLQKHSFSVGFGTTQFTSEVMAPIYPVFDNELQNRLQYYKLGIGYHYLFLKNRKLTFYSKKRYEFSGFSFYAGIVGTQLNAATYTPTLSISDTLDKRQSSEFITPLFEGRITYTNPIFSYRGKVISFYFLHEYGLAFTRGTSDFLLTPDEKITTWFANMSLLSLKFGKKPVFFKFGYSFAAGSKLLQKKKISGSFGVDLQIYFYRTKK